MSKIDGGPDHLDEKPSSVNRLFDWRLSAMLLVGFLVLALVVSIPVMQARQAARRTLAKDRLKQIGIALHQYHEDYGLLPPAYLADSVGKPIHSWRVLLLPYLGQESLYKRFDLTQPWDSPANRNLIAEIPEVYRQTEPGHPVQSTPVMAIVDGLTVWPGPYSTGFRDMIDGLSNTIGVVAVPELNRIWTAPDDLGLDEAAQRFLSPPQAQTYTLVLLMDGRVRAISSRIADGVLKSMLTPHGAIPHPKFPSSVGRLLPPPPFPPLRDSTDFQETSVSIHPGQPLLPGKNAVYCSTFRQAWDELRKLQHEQRVELEHPPDIVELLNHTPIPAGVLTGRTFFASAAKPSQILQECRNRLPEMGPPQLRYSSDSTKDGTPVITCFAALRRSLAFSSPFARLATPLEFRGSSGTIRVDTFGSDPSDAAYEWSRARSLEEILGQVRVLYDASDEEFVIQLATKGEAHDKILLAKVPRSESLQATWNDVRERIAHPQKGIRILLNLDEAIKIPVIALHVHKEIPELTGLQFTSPGNAKGLGILGECQQIIGFRLNETGAEVISWAEIPALGAFGDEPPRQGNRKFLFDTPFLLALMEQNAPEPYLLAWIENGELLQLAK